MNPLYLYVAAVACYANDNDALVPELWANEGLAILEENMVMANLVNRDFESTISKYGDVVNTRRPGEFHIRRKKDGTNLSLEDASSTNVRVPLDQWFYKAFTIKDGEGTLAMQDLIGLYLKPAMQSIARGVDRALLGRVHAFLGTPTTRVGRLGNLNSTNSKDYLLEAREILNKNKAYPENRKLVLAPGSETALLKNDMFLKANERGDGGTALENARLGKILGFDTFQDQNANFVASGDVATGTVTNAVVAAGGSGSQAVTLTGYNVNVGEYVTVAGNDQPTFATARTLSMADTTAVTLNEVTKFATGASAVLTVYKKCDVKGAYAANYSEGIVLDGWTSAPQIGQLVAFGTGGSRKVYTVIESELTAVGEQTVYLDRPLENLLADNDLAFPGPAGAFNWAFHRDALALVSRPLALPNQSTGVMAANATYNGVSMRVTMQYDINAGGTIVNFDMLAGVAVLDTKLAVVLQG
jgi:hypothetical protein